MPDLGPYSVEVLGSYVVTFAALVALIWHSVARARRVRRALEEAEARVRRG